MDGEQRRKEIIELLTTTDMPLSGTMLSKKLGVSRQVIVQDIALLRATNKNILSTNKGYVIFEAKGVVNTYKKILTVNHTDEQTKDELYTIVDEGAKVLDVIVEHELYGQLAGDLLIITRKDVDDFIEKSKKTGARSLKELTNGVHYHTIEAETKEVLARVERKLEEKGYLIL